MSAFTAALVIACLVANFSTCVARGASLAPCSTDDDCAPQLACLGTTDVVNLSPCDDQDKYCACAPRNPISLLCTQAEDTCSEGETCTLIPDSLIEQIRPALLSSQLSLCIDSSQLNFVQNLSTCQDNSQCPDQGECIPVSDTSFCFASVREEQTLPESSPEPSPEGSVLSEPETIESPSATEQPEEAICIAAKSLSHMQRDQLLYAKHYRARVLCDRQGSCATPGHMVLYKDLPMMMSSYCSQVPCRSEIMHVNSPRYQPKLRIPSATDDLTFLAFAARHGTKTEEILLQTATRIGL